MSAVLPIPPILGGYHVVARRDQRVYAYLYPPIRARRGDSLDVRKGQRAFVMGEPDDETYLLIVEGRSYYAPRDRWRVEKEETRIR